MGTLGPLTVTVTATQRATSEHRWVTFRAGGVTQRDSFASAGSDHIWTGPSKLDQL